MNQKRVLITGSAKRIGAAIARHLHQLGMDIVLHYQFSEDEAMQLYQELNHQRQNSAWLFRANLTDDRERENFIENVLALDKKPDVLVNNASAFYPTPIPEASSQDWDTLMDINLKVPLFLARGFQTSLIEQKGCIINLADIHGLKPLKHHAIYSTSKAGLIMLNRAMARELAPAVRVNCIAPGAISWPEGMSDEEQARILNEVPLARRGENKDIALAAEFLINRADYITGQVLTVDGGRTLKYSQTAL